MSLPGGFKFATFRVILEFDISHVHSQFIQYTLRRNNILFRWLRRKQRVYSCVSQEGTFPCCQHTFPNQRRSVLQTPPVLSPKMWTESKSILFSIAQHSSLSPRDSSINGIQYFIYLLVSALRSIYLIKAINCRAFIIYLF